MANLKDLIVNGNSRFLNDAEGKKFIVTGGTSSLFMKADGSLDSNTYLTSVDIANKEDTSNKVTSISSSSTDTLYPSAKLLYDLLALKADKDSDAIVDNIAVFDSNGNPVDGGINVEDLVTEHDYSKDYFTTINVDSVAGTFNAYVYANENLSYSLDGGETWTLISDGTLGRKSTPSVEPGGKVLWKGSSLSGVHYMNSTCPKIDATILFEVCGNLMSLACEDNFILSSYEIADNFSYFFCAYSDVKVKYAHNLIFPQNITFSNNSSGFSLMFAGATALLTAPKKLPAGCIYGGMFYGCTSLTTTPELPINSYFYSMFYGCTSLTKAPELPDTTLSMDNQYRSMFQGCTSLIEAPEINVTNPKFGCFCEMFKNCTSLVKGPSVIKITDFTGYTNPVGEVAGCCESMFEGCTSLIKGPDIIATKIAMYVFKRMFAGCISLKEIPLIAAVTGTNKSSTHYQMFINCTSLEEVSITKNIFGGGLSPNYQGYGMFEGCTSLTKATILTSAGNNSKFGRMFYGCTNLNYIEYTGIASSSYTPSWVDGVAATGTFIKSDTATWDVTGVDGVPTGWTVYTQSLWENVHNYQLSMSNGTITINGNSITPLTLHLDISGKANKISIVNHGTSDTTFELTSNIYHKWGTVSTLTLTLGTPVDATILNEYMFSFTSGATPTTLSLPVAVLWAVELDVEANKTYQVSIIDNLATYLTADMIVANGDVNAPEYATKTYVDGKLALKEDVANKVTSIDANSTNTQYPSAKLVYDSLNPSE